jgi:Methyltransferase domain
MDPERAERLGTAVRLYRSAAMAPFRPLLRRFKKSRVMPAHLAKAWRLFRILNFKYGYLRSVAIEMPVSVNGDPYPWYTYPALEYLRQLNFSTKTVFEYGSGQSTLFWAGRAATVVSVEHNQAWYEHVRAKLPANCTLLYERDSDDYAAAIQRFQQPFDVIVIDGLVKGRTRLKCARAAVQRLRPGGMIILDNSDWLPESSRHLRESGLIEIDMTGFAPGNDYTCTTSFYLHRDFAFQPADDRQPQPGIGAQPYNWEEGAMKERLAAMTLGSEP